MPSLLNVHKMLDPEIRAKLDPQGVQFGGPQTPEAFAAYMAVSAFFRRSSRCSPSLGWTAMH